MIVNEKRKQQTDRKKISMNEQGMTLQKFIIVMTMAMMTFLCTNIELIINVNYILKLILCANDSYLEIFVLWMNDKKFVYNYLSNSLVI